MHRPAFISEALGSFHDGARELEVCATAEGTHDAETGKLLAELDCFVRPVGITEREVHERPAWLPRTQHASEGVDPSEAGDLLRDLFHRWVARVRKAWQDHQEA